MIDPGQARAERCTTPLSRSRALVSAAAASVAELDAALSAADDCIVSRRERLCAALARADVGGDNLLKASRAGGDPQLLAALARSGDGCKLHAAVLPLDATIMALSTEDGRGPLDRYLAATPDEIDGAALALRSGLAAAASALSVAAARLDLQSRFIEAILDEDGVAQDAAHPVVAAERAHGVGADRLDADQLDAESARDLALAVGALLARRPFAIAAGNRRALNALFAEMTSGRAPT